MALLTGKWRVAPTGWSGRLTVQVECSAARVVYTNRLSRVPENYQYWRDAKLTDLQKLGIANENSVTSV